MAVNLTEMKEKLDEALAQETPESIEIFLCSVNRTSRWMNELKQDEVFVFGSNEAGRHGKGAAKQATKWGAKFGIGNGKMGNTYGIPTKDVKLNTLSLNKIKKYVDEFIAYAKKAPSLKFLVTEIGCGLAGLDPTLVAPMFENAIGVVNIHLPKSFWKVLYNKKTK